MFKTKPKRFSEQQLLKLSGVLSADPKQHPGSRIPVPKLYVGRAKLETLFKESAA
jgi:hypothetical protein